MSLICSGVLEEIPALQIVSVECGIAWAAAMAWALDDAARTFGEELATGMRRAPSEQLREHFWFSTQPIEEPEDPEHLAFAYEALGMADRIMFSTDYPHWDFDAPGQALPRSLGKDVRQKILAGNACRLYGLPA
jgi:predicted TIM-barrel fold metal-dependent hydrolase